MDFEAYKSWIKPRFSEGYFDNGSIRSEEIVRSNSLVVLQLLQLHAEKKEFRNLGALAEVLREDGFFYPDYVEEFGVILEKILLQSIAVFDNGDVFNDHAILWLPRSVYDIIFHQITLAECPPVCSILYFELSKRILDSEFMPLYKSEEDSYSQCLYFIDFASDQFLKRGDEFLILWSRIAEQINSGTGYTWDKDWWPVAYQKYMHIK